MKANICDAMGGSPVSNTLAKARRKSIADILRAAYQIHAKDPKTRRAVKRVLR